MAELGVAATIVVKQIAGGVIDKNVNAWLQENPDVEVIDIKFSSSATNDDWATDALIIYRKES
ncbi:hypothetical protein [Terribacillus halophilus]|uniref:hypothetical protein n=1 Tax=Terribacillus halophilus TaxID=361279 RepID=UPI003981FD51